MADGERAGEEDKGQEAARLRDPLDSQGLRWW